MDNANYVPNSLPQQVSEVNADAIIILDQLAIEHEERLIYAELGVNE